jgi:radical SAM superfamily enzyme YgiQ (UPF0313 family)
MASVNHPQFRPPAETESLILQIDQGCPHNRCTFCGMYRHLAYRRLPMAEVQSLIVGEARRHPDARRVFLADGDVMGRPYGELRDILLMLNESFPGLARVGIYANGRSIAAKTVEELRALRQLKLHTLYMGLESGDEGVLKRCKKGDTAAQMVTAGVTAQAAGLRMSVMILLGLGGQDRGAAHARQTAEALNRMQPRLLSALRVIPIAGTELADEAAGGRFQQLTEWQAVAELRDIIERLEMESTVFRANHASNVVPLEGRLPRDKMRLLAELDPLLASSELDRESPGPAPLWL